MIYRKPDAVARFGAELIRYRLLHRLLRSRVPIEQLCRLNDVPGGNKYMLLRAVCPHCCELQWVVRGLVGFPLDPWTCELCQERLEGNEELTDFVYNHMPLDACDWQEALVEQDWLNVVRRVLLTAPNKTR